MVSILPNERTPFDVISKDVGRALQGVLPQAVQQGYQRGQGLQAIEQLQADLASSGGDLSKVLPAIAKAYTMNPSLERSGIAEKFIPLIQRAEGSKQFPAGGGRVPTKPSAEGQKQVPVSAFDLVPPRPSQVTNPQGVSDFQLPYGPEEFAAARQKARELNYLPEVEERFINDMNEFNKASQNKRDVELQNYQQQQQQRRDTLENQNLFNKYLENNAKELWENPDDRELAIQAASRILEDPRTKNNSFTDVLSQVKKDLRPYQAAVKGLEKTLERPLFGRTKEQRDFGRRSAQFMVDKGQKPKLQLMIAKGGNGDVEEADLLNPLSENLEKGLTSLPKFVNPFDLVKTIDVDSPEYEAQLNRGSQKRLKQRENATNYLSKEIVPGESYDKPGTNLLLSRLHLMNNNATWEEAGQIIYDAIDMGKIKLDPQQKIDFVKLSYPPLTGDTYFDTIMNNAMFPITGKQ